MLSPNQLLEQYFKYKDFRPGQIEIINSILSGKHTFAIMPTGGGKSICYQVPALMLSGIAIIVSPLIALMKDQVDTLHRKNIPATFLNSSLSNQEYNLRLNAVANGKYKLLYLAPERLESKKFINFLRQIEISFFAIDEAHCVSEWGHDFRPSYLNISKAIEKISNISVHAFTATATKQVQLDIQKSLKMTDCSVFIKGFDRPNLAYKTEVVDDKNFRIFELVSKYAESPDLGSVVIYAGSRKKVEAINDYLKTYGIKSGYYHAGLADNFRKMQQEDFLNGKQNIMIATNAFGMGIDKADVRVVIHTDLTQTLEAYYQEAGRAGRDGQEAECYFLYSLGDRRLQEFFINMSNPDISTMEKVYNALYNLENISVGANHFDSINITALQLANKVGEKAKTVDNILNYFQREEILRRRVSSGLAKMKFTTSREIIIEYYEHIEDKTVLEALLRSISFAALHQVIEFDADKFLIKYAINKKQFETAMKKYHYAGILNYSPSGQGDGISLLLERNKFDSLPIDWSKYSSRRENVFAKLNNVQAYIETQKCKRDYILDYFGENANTEKCGKCSSCTQTEQSQSIHSKNEFLVQLVLGATHQLNGKFGRKMLSDFILGKNTERIKEHKLHKLELFASACDFSPNHLRDIIEQCFAQNLLAISGGQYPLIILSKDGQNKVKNLPAQFEYGGKKVVKNNPLFEQLKNLRKNIADKDYMNERSIISDASLLKIATYLPKSKEEMSQIKGVTYKFLEEYAQIFLDSLGNIKMTNQSETTYSMPDNLIEYIKSTGDITGASKQFKRSKGDVAIAIQEAIRYGEYIDYYLFCEASVYDSIRLYLSKRPKASLKEIKTNLYLDLPIPELRVISAIVKKEMNIL